MTTFKGKRLSSDPIPCSAPMSIAQEPTMDAAELMSTARAAARLALRGASFPESVREDCRSHLLLWAVQKNAQSRTPDRFSRESFSYGKLAGEAANYRRSVEAQRAREQADIAARSVHGFRSGDKLPLGDRPSGLTPDAAREEAVAMLSALGLPRLGRLFPVVYGACRQGAALVPVLRQVTDKQGRVLDVPTGATALEIRPADADAVAAELGLSVAALRKLTQRAPDKIPACSAGDVETVVTRADGTLTTHIRARYGAPEFCSALGMEDDSANARPVGRAPRAARQNHSGDRERPDVDAPIANRVDKAQRHDKRRRTPVPEWVSKLTPTQRARLEHGVEVKRARMNAKTPAERRHDRQSVGLPATVR